MLAAVAAVAAATFAPSGFPPGYFQSYSAVAAAHAAGNGAVVVAYGDGCGACEELAERLSGEAEAIKRAMERLEAVPVAVEMFNIMNSERDLAVRELFGGHLSSVPHLFYFPPGGAPRELMGSQLAPQLAAVADSVYGPRDAPWGPTRRLLARWAVRVDAATPAMISLAPIMSATALALAVVMAFTV